jgi:hypothetical protein
MRRPPTADLPPVGFPDGWPAPIPNTIGLRVFHIPRLESVTQGPAMLQRAVSIAPQSLDHALRALTLSSRKANHPRRFDAAVRLNKSADRTGAMRERRTRRANDRAEL